MLALDSTSFHELFDEIPSLGSDCIVYSLECQIPVQGHRKVCSLSLSSQGHTGLLPLGRLLYGCWYHIEFGCSLVDGVESLYKTPQIPVCVCVIFYL